MMVIGQGKMNMDAPCVSRRPPQRRKRCLLALLHAEAGDLEALGMDILHAKMLRVRPGAAEKSVRAGALSGKRSGRKRLGQAYAAGIWSARAWQGGHFTGRP